MRILNIVIYNPNSTHEVVMHDAIDNYLKSSTIASFVTSFFVVLRSNTSGNNIEMEDNIIYVNGVESLAPGILHKTMESVRYCITTLNISFDYLYRTNISTVTDFIKLAQLMRARSTTQTFNYASCLSYAYYPSGKLTDATGSFVFAQGTNILINRETTQKICFDKICRNVLDGTLVPDDVAIAVALQKIQVFSERLGEINFKINCSPEDYGKYVCYRNKTTDRNNDAATVANIANFLLTTMCDATACSFAINDPHHENNVYTYNHARCNLSELYKSLMWLHARDKNGFNVHTLTDSNLDKYIDASTMPSYFNKLSLENKIQYVKATIICKYGGIWIDNETIVMDNLRTVFDLFNNGTSGNSGNSENNGFFVKQPNNQILNGIFGSKANTQFMIEWRQMLTNILDVNHYLNMYNNDTSFILQQVVDNNPYLFEKYVVLNGVENVCPVNKEKCAEEFIKKPYENYKQLEREFQPFIVASDDVKNTPAGRLGETQIMDQEVVSIPTAYFAKKSLDKSFENSKCK